MTFLYSNLASVAFVSDDMLVFVDRQPKIEVCKSFAHYLALICTVHGMCFALATGQPNCKQDTDTQEVHESD